MANEIQVQTTSGLTLYAVLLNSTGQIWNSAAFTAIVPADWLNYDIALTEATAGIYLASMPIVAAGTYQFVAYVRAGVAPAITDTQADTGTIVWAGTAVAAPAGTSYATIAQFRQYMTQVPAGATQDALITLALESARALIDSELGFSFAAFGAVATDKDFRTVSCSQYLTLPAYSNGSITHIYQLSGKGTTSESTTEVLATEYAVLTEGAANGERLYRDAGWPVGWYRGTAIWGYGLAPTEIVQVCLEKAINLFIGGQGGQFSDVVGVDGGGAVGYNRAWTNSQRSVLANVRLRYGEYGFA